MYLTGSSALPAAAQLLEPPLPKPPSQVQVARQFLLAVLAGNWEAAYEWLSPATRQTLPMAAFRTATLPLLAHTRHYGPAIDLYKLGYRLREGQPVQPFVAFTYRADTLGPGPHLQLDIAFPDSATRQIQEFRVIQLVRE
ncbi:hypothetical protein [Hymenobacter rubripertinctus]|uniref:DUF3887 domain-containing protein n=1 Tax=Hymenobacter rubripertinctus TaxID=2029981 RepID=A0A418RA49_9BACT|nr:hypothetical protein [Hymenobacter rubripertinctus]RIY14181.1 hypothetical protein D0T11_00385 [Hymenobacter rubripertinctus]